MGSSLFAGPSDRSGVAGVLFGLSAFVSGCDGGTSDVTFEDFRERVRADAGRDAESCGEIAVGQSRLDSDTCLAGAFGNGTDAYAVFRQQGIDSTVASATVVSDGAVTFYDFDGDPSGGGASDNGRISVRSCSEPRLSGDVDGGRVFLCAESASGAPPPPTPPSLPLGRVPFATLRIGDLASLGNQTFPQPRFQVLRDRESLDSLVFGLFKCPCEPEPLPAVDFGESTVIFVAHELETFTGVSIEVTGVRFAEISEAVTVEVLSTGPGDGCQVGDAPSGPFAFYELRTRIETVMFQERTVTRTPC